MWVRAQSGNWGTFQRQWNTVTAKSYLFHLIIQCLGILKTIKLLVFLWHFLTYVGCGLCLTSLYSDHHHFSDSLTLAQKLPLLRNNAYFQPAFYQKVLQWLNGAQNTSFSAVPQSKLNIHFSEKHSLFCFLSWLSFKCRRDVCSMMGRRCRYEERLWYILHIMHKSNDLWRFPPKRIFITGGSHCCETKMLSSLFLLQQGVQ